MGLSLSNILTKANMTNTQTDAATAASVSHVAKNLRGAMILDSLQVGQTISGQIKEMNGSQILLDIGNGVEVNAKLENALDVAVGKSLMFEIKSHAGDKISLSPLYTNLSTSRLPSRIFSLKLTRKILTVLTSSQTRICLL